MCYKTDRFYEELDTFIAAVSKSENFIMLGEFSARVEADHQTLDGNIGRHDFVKKPSVSPTHSQEDVMDAPTLKALAFHWLRHYKEKDKAGVGVKRALNEIEKSGPEQFCGWIVSIILPNSKLIG